MRILSYTLALAFLPLMSNAQELPEDCAKIGKGAPSSKIGECFSAMAIALKAQEIPSGAILIVDSASRCPAGWTDVGNDPELQSRFAGRAIIVSGPTIERGGESSTSSRPFGDNGGKEEVKLSIDEMPMHNHHFQIFYSNVDGNDIETKASGKVPRIKPGLSTNNRWTSEWIPQPDKD